MIQSVFFWTTGLNGRISEQLNEFYTMWKKKLLQPDFRYQPDICLKGLRKIRKNSVRVTGLQVSNTEPTRI
jgi:hypothetical protein